MQSTTHIDVQVDVASDTSSDEQAGAVGGASQASESSDRDSFNWGGITKLRIVAATLFAIGISPSFGIRAVQSLQAFALLLDTLYILPFMGLSDQLVNWIWGNQPVRFFAGGRAVWILLALRGITWSQALLIAFYQTGVDIIVTTLNYFIYHRTLLKYIKGPQYQLAMEFSMPSNPVQLASCELLVALLLRRFHSAPISLSCTAILSLTTFWFERVAAQIVCYQRRDEASVGNMRIFFLHWGPSADSGHWLMQIEGYLVQIFKRNGVVTAEAVVADPNKERPKDHTIPSLGTSLYIPFLRYGIVGLTDKKGLNGIKSEWKGFIEDWISVARYNSATRSCQEFVVFGMYYLCHPPFFNMSDLKSLFPPLLCVMLIYIDLVLHTSMAIATWFKTDIFI